MSGLCGVEIVGKKYISTGFSWFHVPLLQIYYFKIQEHEEISIYCASNQHQKGFVVISVTELRQHRLILVECMW